MNPVVLLILAIALLLGVGVFRLSLSMGWHWGLALFLAAIPLGATVLFGVIGLLGSALFVEALYKASAG